MLNVLVVVPSLREMSYRMRCKQSPPESKILMYLYKLALILRFQQRAALLMCVCVYICVCTDVHTLPRHN